MKQKKPTPKKPTTKKQPPAKAARPSQFSLLGLSHPKLIILSGVLVGLIFGGVGAWTISNSSAATRPTPYIGDPISCTKNVKSAFTYLIAVGFSRNAAAGIVGNLWVESDVLPTKLQGTGTPTYSVTSSKRGYGKLGYGVAQWTTASRQKALVKWANDHGQYVYNLNLQMTFLTHELATGYSGTNSTMRSKTIKYDTAATTFMRQYERPANQGTRATKERVDNARYILSCL